jgi:hypothetical protein
VPPDLLNIADEVIEQEQKAGNCCQDGRVLKLLILKIPPSPKGHGRVAPNQRRGHVFFAGPTDGGCESGFAGAVEELLG